jgi:hypothetical protein
MDVDLPSLWVGVAIGLSLCGFVVALVMWAGDRHARTIVPPVQQSAQSEGHCATTRTSEKPQ